MTDVRLRDLTLDELTDHYADWLGRVHREERRPLFVPLLRELATGRPVDPGRLAAAAGLSPEVTLATLRDFGAEWDASGARVAGFVLTGIRTPYEVEFRDRTMWAWCAPDAIGIAAVIGAPVRVRSSCTVTGDPVRVEVTPAELTRLEPAGAVISFVLPPPEQADLRHSVCGNANFYRDTDAASAWQDAQPSGRLLSVADAFDMFGRAVRRVWPELRSS